MYSLLMLSVVLYSSTIINTWIISQGPNKVLYSSNTVIDRAPLLITCLIGVGYPLQLVYIFEYKYLLQLSSHEAVATW